MCIEKAPMAPLQKLAARLAGAGAARHNRSMLSLRDAERLVLWSVLGLVLIVVRAQPAAAQSLVETGRRIAEMHCSRCHVVDPEKPFAGISSTPSFQLLVTALPDWKERFETFYARRPHPSVMRFEGSDPLTDNPPTTQPVYLKVADIDAIVAFAVSLNEAGGAAD
jgi:mono/diheme cytochrome c family protein